MRMVNKMMMFNGKRFLLNMLIILIAFAFSLPVLPPVPQPARQKEIITIVDKHEYRKLMDYVKKVDPKAFVTVYSVNEIRYQPKV